MAQQSYYYPRQDDSNYDDTILVQEISNNIFDVQKQILDIRQRRHNEKQRYYNEIQKHYNHQRDIVSKKRLVLSLLMTCTANNNEKNNAQSLLQPYIDVIQKSNYSYYNTNDSKDEVSSSSVSVLPFITRKHAEVVCMTRSVELYEVYIRIYYHQQKDIVREMEDYMLYERNQVKKRKTLLIIVNNTTLYYKLQRKPKKKNNHSAKKQLALLQLSQNIASLYLSDDDAVVDDNDDIDKMLNTEINVDAVVDDNDGDKMLNTEINFDSVVDDNDGDKMLNTEINFDNDDNDNDKSILKGRSLDKSSNITYYNSNNSTTATQNSSNNNSNERKYYYNDDNVDDGILSTSHIFKEEKKNSKKKNSTIQSFPSFFSAMKGEKDNYSIVLKGKKKPAYFSPLFSSSNTSMKSRTTETTTALTQCSS